MSLLVIMAMVSSVMTQGYSPVPVIIDHPLDQVVQEAGAAVFSCRFTSPSPLTSTVSWYREGVRQR